MRTDAPAPLGQVPSYDAHVAYVAKTERFHVPCPPERWAGPAPVYSELVVFESAAVLPRFVLALHLPD